jgi:hypothetical protein
MGAYVFARERARVYFCKSLETTEEQQADRYVTVHSIISFCCWAGVGQTEVELVIYGNLRTRQSQVSKLLLRAMTVVAFQVILLWRFKLQNLPATCLLHSSKVQRQLLSGCALYW